MAGASQVALGKEPTNAGDIKDVGSVPGSERSPGGGHGKPLHYSCLENSHGQRSLWATVHGVTKSQTQLSDKVHNMSVSMTKRKTFRVISF